MKRKYLAGLFFLLVVVAGVACAPSREEVKPEAPLPTPTLALIAVTPTVAAPVSEENTFPATPIPTVEPVRVKILRNGHLAVGNKQAPADLAPPITPAEAVKVPAEQPPLEMWTPTPVLVTEAQALPLTQNPLQHARTPFWLIVLIVAGLAVSLYGFWLYRRSDKKSAGKPALYPAALESHPPIAEKAHPGKSAEPAVTEEPQTPAAKVPSQHAAAEVSAVKPAEKVEKKSRPKTAAKSRKPKTIHKKADNIILMPSRRARRTSRPAAAVHPRRKRIS